MNNIILIGMPGCGKSTVGVLLAKTLGARFLDTDLVIQEREGKLLQQILDTSGFEAFLEAEERALLSVLVDSTVVATGGSAVYSNAGMAHLKKSGMFIYLRLSYKEVMSRLNNIKTRGIAVPQGKTMWDVYTQRIPLYEHYADLTVDCEEKTLEEVVSSLAEALIQKPNP